MAGRSSIVMFSAQVTGDRPTPRAPSWQAPSTASWPRMRQPPEQGEETIDTPHGLSRLLDPAPRNRGLQRRSDLVRTAVGDRIMLRLVALHEPLPLGEIERDARCGALELIGEIAILPLDHRNHGSQSPNNIQRNFIRDEHELISLGDCWRKH